MTNKVYQCRLVDTPEWYNRNKFWFISELADTELTITLNGETYRFNYFIRDHYKVMLDNDVCAIRFLPSGLGLMRRSKFISTHESNPWPSVLNGIDSLSTHLSSPILIGEHDTPVTHSNLESAFDRTGVLVRAGKFAKSIGCSDVEAEQFSRDYDKYFGEDDSDKYSLELVEGDDIVEYYKSSNYAERNGSPLWSSCMNGKSSIVRFYAKNKRYIKMAVLFDSDRKVVGRSIVWLDATIREWGGSSYVCTEDKLLYKGMFADRMYYHHDTALDVMRKKMDEMGIAYKRALSFGDGEVIVPVDGVAKNYDSGYLFIKANIGLVGGPVPYLDTLCYASSNKCVANRVVDGKVKRCSSTEGRTDAMGEFVKVDVGLGISEAKFAFKPKRQVAKVVLPNGKVVYALGSDSLGLARGCDSFSDHYIIASVTSEYTIDVPQVSYWSGDTSLRIINVRVYAHQLTYDFNSKSFKVSMLYDDKSGKYHPVDEFLIKSVGRGSNRSARLVHSKREALRLHEEFTQVNY